jgi:hypothetical protein
LGVEAALAAMELHGHEQAEKRRQLDNALQAARYETARAHRQYDAADPDNRLVARELERRWNEKLTSLHALEEDIATLDAIPASSLSPGDRERLLVLGRDLASAWESPGITVETRKKIIRLVVAEIIVDVSDTLDLVIHWQGGDHTKLTVKKNKAGHTRWTTDTDVIDLIRALARQMPDETIAAVLNRSGRTTGKGNNWTRTRVCSVRYQKEIAPYCEGERNERGEATLEEAAGKLGVSSSTVRRLIGTGILPAQQFCKGAPWIIRSVDLERDDLRREASIRRTRRPASSDPQQKAFNL